MDSPTSTHDLVHPLTRDVIAERTAHSPQRRGGEEVAMDSDTRDDFHVGINASNERCLHFQFLECTANEVIKDIKDMVIKRSRCDPQGGLLAPHGF